MGYNIGFFKATDTGYTGTIETLALKVQAEFHRVLNRTNQNDPAFDILSGDLKIGAACERTGKNGKYLSVSLEDPSFSPGFYNLYRNRGVEDGQTLVFDRPKSEREDAPAKQAA
jgi:uncharacterized protein (DUF736 family)